MKKTGLYRFAQIFFLPIFRLLFRCKIIGSENVPKDGPVLMCSNHTTYKDPLFLGCVQKRQVWFMAKKELFNNKFFGWIINKLGAFPVDRSVGAGAINRGIEILENDGVVGIFIEGTRSKTGELLKPKPGVVMLAYDTNATVVPLCILGKNGKPPRIFKKTIINVGKPMPVEALGMSDGSGVEMRKASRHVMEEISKLREDIVSGSLD